MNLLVLTARPPAGTGFYAINLFEALVARAPSDVKITGFAAAAAIHYFSPRARARLHTMPSQGRTDRIRNEVMRLPRATRTAGVDLVINPAFLGVPWGSPQRALVIHDLYFRTVPALIPLRRRWLLRLISPWLAQRSNLVFADTMATKADISRFYPTIGARTIVLYPGVRTLGDKDESVSTREKDFLLMVGTLTANKLPDVVIEALARLRAGGREVRLIHIGDDLGRLAPLAAAAGVGDAVQTLGRQPDPVLLAHYAASTAVVLPSISEGFGLPLIEAQAGGAPVIAADCAALVEVGGDGAMFFSVADPDTLVRAAEVLLDDPTARTALIARGSANAARFTWDRAAAELLAAADNVV